MGTKRLKAFTLAEMLVTLALTSLLVTFCYLGYNYIQQLLNQFGQQNLFVTQLNELNKRGTALANVPGTILAEGENRLIFRSDSSESRLEWKEDKILLSRFGKTDTFYLAARPPVFTYEALRNPLWQNKLVSRFEFDIYFQKQKFHLTFHKNYDAFTKLKLEQDN